MRSKPHHVTLPGCGEAAGRHEESIGHVLKEELLQPITEQQSVWAYTIGPLPQSRDLDLGFMHQAETHCTVD